MFGVASTAGSRLPEASWEPNFSSALPTIGICVFWIFFLCLTLPSRSTAWCIFRLASFPALAALSISLTFDRNLTLGNPLRDISLPTITWTMICKTVEVCIVYSKGGPRWIRPFLPKSQNPVTKMEESEYAVYEWKEVAFPEFLSWDRFIYSLDVLFLRRVGTSPILPGQGRALEWSKRGLNEWSRYLRVNKCGPKDIPAHSPVRRFGQPEMHILAGSLQFLFVCLSFKWLYALATPASEVLQVLGLYIPIGSIASPRVWHAILPTAFTSRHLVLLGIPSSAFDLPLLTRLAMTVSMGGSICLTPGLLESITLLFYKPSPATSFLSSFERPVSSPDLAKLWARSWHSLSQRDYLNMAQVMPFSRHPVMHMLYVFFWSGVQHSWMLARLRTAPSAKINFPTILTGMIDPGMTFFFMSQSIGILAEKAVLDAMPAGWKKHQSLIGLGRRLWMFTVLVVPGFFFLDSVLQTRSMTKDIMDGFGFRALGSMVMGKKY
ncbi:uncharacterized protein MEPE_01218 [Melanopsichium pennsylvanicum]|uniref:Wax synthase domain-containing protein n=2 Tax=Melanopsichium pennsylvanicum TaxID=63383 RepID=A0AAJ4XI85_9BASI|nr:hypothetical protein BN887_00709 [Melanopsichium pennsylvanicum 4]SNX82512.1 uncharacterized protein MEPE_01218 [Melanopsichium pennsylvanicum]